VSNTKDLKRGDKVIIKKCGLMPIYTEATVVKVVSTKNAQVKVHRYIDPVINPDAISIFQRKFMMKI
jgi:hypothetical protein